MVKFLCIGGMCLGGIILKHSTNEEIKHLKTPINNVGLKRGFIDCHKYFDGTFEKEVILGKSNLKYRFCEGEKFPHQWVSLSYRFMHIDLNDEKNHEKIKKRFNNSMEFIKNPDKDYYFLYSLNKKDLNLSVEEIEKELNILSKYIDINRILFLGSRKYNDIDEIPCDVNIANNKFSYTNENFKKVAGNRYMEIYPSNIYVLAAKDFENKFNELIRN